MGEHADALNHETSHDSSVPLDAATEGRLVFASGAAGITLRGDPALSDLYRAHFEHSVPNIQVRDGVVTVRYRHHSLLDWPTDWPRPVNYITLNGSIPWDIEIRGGTANLTADLRALPLRAFDLSSVSQTIVTLSRPVGAAYVYISGSASDVVIHRPADVALRVQIGNSASNIRCDEQFFGAVVDGLRWQTPDFGDTVDRYEISISGSASNVTIDAR